MLPVRVTAATPPEQLVQSLAVGDVDRGTTLQGQHWHMQLIKIQSSVQACCAL